MRSVRPTPALTGGLRSFGWARVAVGLCAWERSRGLSSSSGSWSVGSKPKFVLPNCPLPGRQERVCLGSVCSWERRAQGARGPWSRTPSGVPCSGRWGVGVQALGPHCGGPFSGLEPTCRSLGTPWGLDVTERTASPPVCACGPAALSPRRGCAPGLDASGVVRALVLVSSLTPLSLGPAGGTAYFILLLSSEGAKTATRAGTWNRRL